MADQLVGRISGIALRGRDRGPMHEVSEVRAHPNGGLENDVKSSLERGLTLLAARQWEQVVSELGVELPWHTRRANILIETEGLGHLIGRKLRVGEAEMEVLAETKPCAQMETLHKGLRAALAGDCRGGVHGQITRGGLIRTGDAVSLHE